MNLGVQASYSSGHAANSTRSLLRSGPVLLIRDAAVIKTDKLLGSFLAVQCLGLCASTAGGMGSIPGQETNILHPTHLQAQKKRKKKIGQEGWRHSKAKNKDHKVKKKKKKDKFLPSRNLTF